MYEISYLISKLTVEKVMVKKVITVDADDVIEEAARIMETESVGCLPVLKSGILVGIVTESDLFHAFVDMFAAREPGVRVTFLAEEKPGELAKVTRALTELNANIEALVTYAGENISNKRCTLKVDGINKDALKSVLEKTGVIIEDIR
jgi:acetoin utilization protein AcuB